MFERTTDSDERQTEREQAQNLIADLLRRTVRSTSQITEEYECVQPYDETVWKSEARGVVSLEGLNFLIIVLAGT